MPMKDYMTGSPFRTVHDYEEYRDPALSQHAQTTEKKGFRQGWISKHSTEKQKGEHGKLWKFADNVHYLKEKTQRHM